MAVKSAKLTDRFRRMAERLLKANLAKDVVSLDFITRKLGRKGVVVDQNLCQLTPTLYIIKDIEFIGRGAACLIHACDRCVNGDRYIESIYESMDPTKGLNDLSAQPFSGGCAFLGKSSKEKDPAGSVNRLLIVPDAREIKRKKLECPFWLSTENIEVQIGGQTFERTNFNV